MRFSPLIDILANHSLILSMYSPIQTWGRLRKRRSKIGMGNHLSQRESETHHHPSEEIAFQLHRSNNSSRSNRFELSEFIVAISIHSLFCILDEIDGFLYRF